MIFAVRLRLLWSLVVAALLAACAAVAPSTVAYMPVNEIVADNARLPPAGYLSSGQPNAAALSAIAAARYAGVVDLRTANEPRGFDEAGTAAELGLRYAALPVAGPDGVTFENAAKLDALLAEFDGPVLLHCGSGNRVGALFALRAKAAGASNEEALEVGRAAGLTSLEDVVRQRLAESN